MQNQCSGSTLREQRYNKQPVKEYMLSIYALPLLFLAYLLCFQENVLDKYAAQIIC